MIKIKKGGIGQEEYYTINTWYLLSTTRCQALFKIHGKVKSGTCGHIWLNKAKQVSLLHYFLNFSRLKCLVNPQKEEGGYYVSILELIWSQHFFKEYLQDSSLLNIYFELQIERKNIDLMDTLLS